MKRSMAVVAVSLCSIILAFSAGCGQGEKPDSKPAEVSSDVQQASQPAEEPDGAGFANVEDTRIGDTSTLDTSTLPIAAPDKADTSPSIQKPKPEDIGIIEDYRESLEHGDKGAEFQKYIVLHDTEGEGDPSGVIDYWDSNGALVAAHFVIGKDGSIWQCVPLDKIAHHAGYGDAGHNEQYEIEEDGRDDMLGTVPIGDWAPDYGMNAWSIGIEMVHVGGTGYYPEEQLEALDDLIAYIDAYYDKKCDIIDHKAWRSGNSDTSPEFEEYLANYQDHRTHD